VSPSAKRASAPSDRKGQAKKVLAALRKLYPDAHCELDFKTPLQLVVATILSAQCTDRRVNLVTPKLFARYKTAADYAASDPVELESIIKSTGFYRSKSMSIREMARVLVEKHGGQVPRRWTSSSSCAASRARRRTSCSAPPTASLPASSSTPT
jgi:endonuclease-3